MIDLYSAATPNGRKISIALEELELPYTLHPVRLDKLEQKEPAFLAMNPNGRIPVIVDREAGDFVVFESGAILLYLAEKTGRLMPAGAKSRSVAMQWLMFQVGNLGPMQGQAHVFYRYAPEKIDYAIQRYQAETRRLYEVLNTRLQHNEYLAGDYSIADIATWPWAVRHDWPGVPVDDLPHLTRWLDLVGARPAVQRGKEIPPSVRKAQSVVEGGQKMLVK